MSWHSWTNPLAILQHVGVGTGFAKRWIRPASDFSRKVQRETLTLAAGQCIAIVGALVGVRILSSALGPKVYGQLALSLSVATLLTSAAAGPVGNGVGRCYASAKEREQEKALLKAMLRCFGEIYLVVVACAALALSWAVSAERSWVPTIILVLTISLLWGANSVLDCLQNAARQRIVVAWHQACGHWLRNILAVLLVYCWGASCTNALCGYMIAAGLVLGSQLALFRMTLWPAARLAECRSAPASKALVSQMRSYGFPFAAWGAIAWLQQGSDRWVLGSLTGTRQVGLYQVLYQLGYYPIMLASGLAAQMVGPVLFSRAGDGSEHRRTEPVRNLVLNLSRYTLVGTLGLSVIAWLFHDVVFALFVPVEYRSVASLLPLMVLASGLFATGQMLAFDALIQMNSKLLLWPKIGSALIAVGLNCLGALVAGLTGVVYATVLSSAAYMVWIFLLTLKPTHPSLLEPCV